MMSHPFRILLTSMLLVMSAAFPLLARDTPSLILRNESGSIVQIMTDTEKSKPVKELSSPVSLGAGAVLSIDFDVRDPEPIELVITSLVAFQSFEARRAHDVVEICRLAIVPTEETVVVVNADYCVTESGR